MEDTEKTLKEKMRVLKYHLYIQNEQYRKCNEIKTNMKEDEILLYVDFAESYQNTQQNKVQSAYFGHNNLSFFTACCYVRITELKTLDKRSVAIGTEASNHSRIVTHSLILKVMNEIRQIYLHLPHDITIHLFQRNLMLSLSVRSKCAWLKAAKQKQVFIIFNLSRLLQMKNHSIPTGMVDQKILLILVAISTFRMIIISGRLVLVV